MTPWLLRYQSRLDVVAMRLSYADLPSEDTSWADYYTADSDGTVSVWPLTRGRVEWFAGMEYERGQIYSEQEVYQNRGCDCRRELVQAGLD